MTKIPPCCVNSPMFLIEYILGSKFLVCSSCIKSSCWSRGIKEKISITNGVIDQRLLGSILND